MHACRSFLIRCLVPLLLVSVAQAEPLTPAEAAKKINEKVVLRMEVKSTGGRGNRYLNSEEDFKNPANFTIFISKDDLEKFKKAGIEKPEEHFKGKVIEVTGTVVLEMGKPQIKLKEPEQIKVVVKENP
ncbi:hypothetical protein [Schlesneria sp. DSM 10557]|uniref:hypothetical protein n=1 Tax=Schlesneria sp. DSM 10557 TaxID=3044399 RepID=UPI00359FA323